MIARGTIVWADLGAPSGSLPAKRRPVVVISADSYNRSRLRTMLVAGLTSNTGAAAHPGNVFLPASATGLPRDSVVNVTQLVTVEREQVEARGKAGEVPGYLMVDVDAGLRLAMDL